MLLAAEGRQRRVCLVGCRGASSDRYREEKPCSGGMPGEPLPCRHHPIRLSRGRCGRTSCWSFLFAHDAGYPDGIGGPSPIRRRPDSFPPAHLDRSFTTRPGASNGESVATSTCPHGDGLLRRRPPIRASRDARWRPRNAPQRRTPSCGRHGLMSTFSAPSRRSPSASRLHAEAPVPLAEP